MNYRGENIMQTISAIYDGNFFKPMEPIPVEGKYEVLITFTKPIDTKSTKRKKILKYFGTWDDEDVKVINQIVEERKNFSMGRDEI
jgi:predicted DNA-binding antitoxin AbrB/MazE fold protein